MNRRGFTLIELMVVVLVLSVLAGIALLKYMDLRNSAIATQMGQEMRAVTIASINYYADREQWPPETGAGAVPNGLGPLLPGQLAASFDRGQYVLDYDRIGDDGSGYVIGVSVTTSDPKLFAKFVQYLGTTAPFSLSGNSLTYLIAGPGGFF
jgi:prepilin-type N-terminal cleavage/methylation domain-containing protein